MKNFTKSVETEKRVSIWRLVLALILLVNPVVRVVDILPDFIGAFLIVSALGYAADRAPFFEEARRGFIKLAFISLAKIPAFLIISMARGQNTLDNDTSVLFTFVFSIIEAIVLVNATRDLFAGLFHLGQRTDASATVKPFAISKRSERTATPESLQTLAIVFTVVRAALTALPELLLLTRSTDDGKYLFNIRALYPYSIVLSVLIVLILGIILAKRGVGYMRAINEEGKLISGIESLITDERAIEIEKKQASRRTRTAMTVLIVAAFMTLELRVDNLSSVNMLPHFIYGALLLAGGYFVCRHSKVKLPLLISSAAYTAMGLVGFFLEISFADKHGFESLIRDGAARDAYIPLIVFAALELIALVVTLILLCRGLLEFSLMHTGVDPHSDRYGRQEAELHSEMKKRIICYTTVGILVGIAKLLDVVFRYFSDRTYVALEDTIGTVVAGLVPWFSVVLTVLSGIYICISFYTLGKLRDEAENKYS